MSTSRIPSISIYRAPGSRGIDREPPPLSLLDFFSPCHVNRRKGAKQLTFPILSLPVPLHCSTRLGLTRLEVASLPSCSPASTHPSQRNPSVSTRADSPSTDESNLLVLKITSSCLEVKWNMTHPSSKSHPRLNLNRSLQPCNFSRQGLD